MAAGISLGVVLIGFVVVRLADAYHLFSSILYYANLGIFIWAGSKIGVATYERLKVTLGEALAGVVAIIVGFAVAVVLFASLDKMSHDMVRNYFDSKDDGP